MLAESGGRNTAANPRSSALGPFQFIRSTFIEVARRNFTAEVAALSDEKLLELRTDRAFSRRAAEAFTAENAAFLKQQGHPATFTNLHLAFLLGAPGAARVLQAPPQTRLSELLGPAVLRANPFMIGMSVVHLVEKSARDIWGRHAGTRTATRRPPAAATKIVIKCNQKLVSCQRWIALQQQKRTRKTRNASKSDRGGKV